MTINYSKNLVKRIHSKKIAINDVNDNPFKKMNITEIRVIRFF